LLPHFTIRVLKLKGHHAEAKQLRERFEYLGLKSKDALSLDAVVWLVLCMRELDRQMELIDELKDYWPKDSQFLAFRCVLAFTMGVLKRCTSAVVCSLLSAIHYHCEPLSCMSHSEFQVQEGQHIRRSAVLYCIGLLETGLRCNTPEELHQCCV
jgi:hypothetical protein